MKLKIHFLIIGLIILLGVVSYFNTLQNSFVWDDFSLIEQNPYIKSISHLKEVFTTHLFHGSRAPSNFYRPMHSLSLMVDYKIWKLNPVGYHLTNLLLHILVSILIYVLVNMLSQNIIISAIASLLFVVHPVHTGAVSYVSSRADLLAGFFLLLAFVLYVVFRKTAKPKWFFIFPLVSFVFGLLSKEGAIVFPLIFLLYEHVFIEKKKRKYSLLTPYVIIIIIYALLRISILNFKTEEITTTAGLPVFIRLLTFCKVFFLYIKLLFVPFGLHMERYVEPVYSLGDIYGFFAFSGIVFIFYIMFLLNKWNNKLLLFSFSYFFITLIPVSNIIPLNALMLEHWIYIPSSLGFFMIVAILLEKVFNFKYLRPVVILILISAISWYSFLTIQRNKDWKDSFTFWSSTVKLSPKSYKAHLELGVALAKKDLRDEAIKEFEKAYELNPRDYKALNNLGRVYTERGDFKKGEELYQKSLMINKNDGLTYNGLGNVYLMTNRIDEAIACYNKAIESNPYMASFYSNLGKAFEKIGEAEKAKNAFKEAIDINPSDKNAIEYFKEK